MQIKRAFTSPLSYICIFSRSKLRVESTRKSLVRNSRVLSDLSYNVSTQQVTEESVSIRIKLLCWNDSILQQKEYNCTPFAVLLRFKCSTIGMQKGYNCKRIRDASIYTSKKYRSSFYSWAIFFCFHLSGSNSRYLLSDVLGGSAAALLMTSDIYSKKLIPCSLHEHASE